MKRRPSPHRPLRCSGSGAGGAAWPSAGPAAWGCGRSERRLPSGKYYICLIGVVEQFAFCFNALKSFPPLPSASLFSSWSHNTKLGVSKRFNMAPIETFVDIEKQLTVHTVTGEIASSEIIEVIKTQNE